VWITNDPINISNANLHTHLVVGQLEPGRDARLKPTARIAYIIFPISRASVTGTKPPIRRCPDRGLLFAQHSCSALCDLKAERVRSHSRLAASVFANRSTNTDKELLAARCTSSFVNLA
jgi:hypothetical protein